MADETENIPGRGSSDDITYSAGIFFHQKGYALSEKNYMTLKSRGEF